MRGIRYVQIPTTFLAQVDSSIGGKPASISSPEKTSSAAFHHPQAVFADTISSAPFPPPNSAPACRSPSKPASSMTQNFRYMEQNADAILAGNPTALTASSPLRPRQSRRRQQRRKRIRPAHDP